MSGAVHGLGGRLDLADRVALDGTARELFDHITATVVAWARRSGFAAATADGRLIGPFNPSLLNPGISADFLELQTAEQQYTSLDECTRQVVILTVGSVWRAPYELYAHCGVAAGAGYRNRRSPNWSPAPSPRRSPTTNGPPTAWPGRCPPPMTSTTRSMAKRRKNSAPRGFSTSPC